MRRPERKPRWLPAPRPVSIIPPTALDRNVLVLQLNFGFHEYHRLPREKHTVAFQFASDDTTTFRNLLGGQNDGPSF
jgi:hypothetical protein